MLMTEKLRKSIPSLYSGENIPIKNQVVHAKFFINNSTWWILEYSEQKKIFFGFVDILELELGYISEEELLSININGLKVERDLYFTAKKVSEIVELKDALK